MRGLFLANVPWSFALSPVTFQPEHLAIEVSPLGDIATLDEGDVEGVDVMEMATFRGTVATKALAAASDLMLFSAMHHGKPHHGGSLTEQLRSVRAYNSSDEYQQSREDLDAKYKAIDDMHLANHANNSDTMSGKLQDMEKAVDSQYPVNSSGAVPANGSTAHKTEKDEASSRVADAAEKARAAAGEAAHKLRVAKYAGEHFLSIADAEKALAKQDAEAAAKAKLVAQPKPPGKEITEKLSPKEPMTHQEKLTSWVEKITTWQTSMMILVLMIIIYATFEVLHQRALHQEWAVGRPTEREQQVPPQFSSANFKLAYEYFTGDGRVRGTILLSTAVALSLVNIWMSYSINMLVARYWDALKEKATGRFIESLTAFVVIHISATVGDAYGQYLRRIFLIHWRESLTRRSWKRWLDNSAHYHSLSSGTKLENPDQRIQVDCDRYVGITMGLMTDFVGTLGSLCVFLPVLYRLSPPIIPVRGWLCYGAMIYSMVGTWVMQVLGDRIAMLSYAMERAEADFRASLITVRDYSEGVAMYGAEDAEMRLLDHFFQHLRGVYWTISFLQRRLGFFSGTYGTLSDLLPIFLLSPAYFSGALTMGSLLQVRHALGEVTNGFSWFMNSYFTIAEWSAVSTRLAELDKLAESRERELAEQPERLANLEVSNLELEADGKQLLAGAASFRLRPGDWALLTGPEGAGKSTVLRAIKGKWPVKGGRVGPATGLPADQVMFVPAARASGLRYGTLTDAVAYPQRVGTMRQAPAPRPAAEAAATGETGSTGEAQPTGPADAASQEETERAEVVEALNAVGLGHLWPKGEPEPVQDWGRTLSSGELSRLLLARALVLKPEILCMDEPVAHCAEGEPTKQLFQTIKGAMPPHTAVLTVSHDVGDLQSFHNVRITLDPKAKALHAKSA